MERLAGLVDLAYEACKTIRLMKLDMLCILLSLILKNDRKLRI